MKNRFKNNEKLKSKKLIEQLFSEGSSISAYPLRLVFLETTFSDAVNVKASVSVSKRNFKNAVDRNRIKRLIREAYRLNKTTLFNNISTQYAFMFLYIGKEKPSLSELEVSINKLFKKFIEKHPS